MFPKEKLLMNSTSSPAALWPRITSVITTAASSIITSLVSFTQKHLWVQASTTLHINQRDHNHINPCTCFAQGHFRWKKYNCLLTFILLCCTFGFVLFYISCCSNTIYHSFTLCYVCQFVCAPGFKLSTFHVTDWVPLTLHVCCGHLSFYLQPHQCFVLCRMFVSLCVGLCWTAAALKHSEETARQPVVTSLTAALSLSKAV